MIFFISILKKSALKMYQSKAG